MRSLFYALLLIFYSVAQGADSADGCRGPLLGLPTEIVITDKAMNHILQGDITQTPGRSHRSIKGGLHTVRALNSFLDERDDIFQLGAEFMTPTGSAADHRAWYFASTNYDNGVVHVRLPERAFQKRQLKKLLASELNLNSGYLWKTLFPEDMGRDEIEAAIRFVFENPMAVENKGWAASVRGSYQRENGAVINMTLYLNTNTGELSTAFPSYAQPGGIHGPLSSQRSLIIEQSRPELSGEGADLSVFDRMIRNLLGTGIHEPARFFTRNYRQWNSLGVQAKREKIEMLVGGLMGFRGSFSVWEETLPQIYDDYEKETFSAKVLEIIDAIVQDRDLDQGEKIQFLSTIISNQRALGGRYERDTVVFKYILTTTLELASKLEFGYQKHIIRVIEDSPIYWTLMMPFHEGIADTEDPFLFGGRVLNLLSFAVGGGEDTTDMATFAKLIPFAKEIEGKEWLYLKLLAQIESFEEGFVTKSMPRLHFVMEFLNMNAFKIAAAEYVHRVPDRTVYLYGREFDEREIRPSSTKQAVMRSLRRNRSTIASFLLGRRGVNRWLRFLDVFTQYDRDLFRATVDEMGLDFEEEMDEIIYELQTAMEVGNNNPPISYPLFKVERLEGGSGELDIHLKAMFYQFVGRDER